MFAMRIRGIYLIDRRMLARRHLPKPQRWAMPPSVVVGCRRSGLPIGSRVLVRAQLLIAVSRERLARGGWWCRLKKKARQASSVRSTEKPLGGPNTNTNKNNDSLN
jgi:hypothetical protein